ncbi:acyltransferase family protein [Pseudomonas sp. NPDC090202]|uniref:acyltransferase family protein n=1 Tax=unclassified Pseudomonas TaxID=196821 RepID=UPI00381C5482
MKNPSKIIFANQLRGVAALLVVLSHLCSVFWGARDTVALYTGALPIEGAQPGFGFYLTNQHWNTGALGVAIFFAISGFVIPMSLGSAGRLRFLVARAFRIYPTYIAALSLALFAVWLSCHYWGHPFMWKLTVILRNMMLVHNLTGAPTVDLVNWTLAVELKFYLVAALIAPLIVAGRVWPLIGIALLVYGVNRFSHTALGTEMYFVTFMFMGVLFNYQFRGLIGLPKFLASLAVIFGLFVAGWDASPWPDALLITGVNYLYGLLIFGAAYLARHHFRNLRPLDFLADISYPLYILHSLIGYSVMRVLFDRGLDPWWVAAVTALVILLAATLIHVLVERPTIALGKALRRPPATSGSPSGAVDVRAAS